jgi:hypothetical protein
MIEMLYSEPHQAISAFIGVVCTTQDYCPEIETIGRGTKFLLKPEQAGAVGSEWEALDKPMRIGGAPREMADLLRRIWPKPARWLSDNEDVWWFPAQPVRREQRDELLRRHWQGVLSAA